MIFLPEFQRYSRHVYRTLSIHQTVLYSLVSSASTLESAMKELIDTKRYTAALKLYHQRSNHLTDISSTLALKACTLTGRRADGLRIHQQLSQQSLQNPFIQSSLIHFYMQCQDVDSAEKIFSEVTRKNIYMYGAMFKGYIANGRPGKVLELFGKMTLKPDAVLATMVFNACAKLNDDQAKQTGMELLRQLPEEFFDHEKLLNSGIDMLMKFGEVRDAEQLFQSMRNKTIATYGIMVKGYTTNSMADKALDIIDRLPLEPNGFLYTHIYNACASLCNERAINVGQKLLDKMPKKYIDDIILTSAAIDMLMKFSHVSKAEELFKLMPKKNIVTYGAMMKGYLMNNSPEKTLDLVNSIPFRLNAVLYAIVFDACSSLSNERAVALGKTLLNEMPKEYLDDPIVISSAVRMLMKFGDVIEAEELFHSCKHQSNLVYTAMMRGYVANDLPTKALDLFESHAFEMDEVLYGIVFDACSSLSNERAMELGTKLIDQMRKKHISDPLAICSAIRMLMKFGDMSSAEDIFHATKHQSPLIYRAMMRGYKSNDLPTKALDLFETRSFEMDEVLYGIVFDACSSLSNERAVALGKTLLNEMPKEYLDDPIVISSAVRMLMKFGDVIEAEELFHSTTHQSNLVYTAMMKGYVANDLPTKALDLFESRSFEMDEVLYGIVFDACSSLSNEKAIGLGKKLINQMPKEYFSNSLAICSAIRMLMKLGDVMEAESLYSKAQLPAIVGYNAMIQGYNSIHQPSKALEILERIKEDNLFLDESISISLIKACSQIGLLSTCQRVIECIPPQTYHNPRVIGAVIDMWGKAGAIERAEKLFYSISTPNLYNYSSMINAYGRNGMGTEAIDLYYRVPEKMRNTVMDVCVLNACSHAGLIDQAQSIFKKIERKNAYTISVMVDCYARMFMFDQAQLLITQYEQSNPPEKVMYMALLSGARNHRRADLAQKLYDRMKTLFSTEKSFLVAASTLVSNTYSSVGDYEQSQAIRKDRIKFYGYKVLPGLTWTEVNHELVEFRAHAHHHHPRAAEIQVEIERIAHDLRKNGHQYDASWIIRPLKRDENIESVLCGHSEKLAIAYNFIDKPPPSVIQVTKNLRVCGDCHAATKLIAKIRQVEIIVRDANRIHHFHKNGQCSCQDHF